MSAALTTRAELSMSTSSKITVRCVINLRETAVANYYCLKCRQLMSVGLISNLWHETYTLAIDICELCRITSYPCLFGLQETRNNNTMKISIAISIFQVLTEFIVYEIKLPF